MSNTYVVAYNPELSQELIEEIAFAFSPSLVSHDKEEPTGVFSLSMIMDFLDRRLLVTADEKDVTILNNLIESEVSYIEIYL